jgi:hypothetical protein
MASNLKTNLTSGPYPVESITRLGQWEPFDLQIGRSQIMGHQAVNVFGYTTALGNVNQAVWEGSKTIGGDYVFPTASAQLVLVSTSASDGTALSVQINGLDSNFNTVTETIALNGTSSVTSVNSYFRVNNLYTTNGINVGTVTATQGGATIYAQINPGIGQTEMSVYTVPNGYIFYRTIIQANSSITSGGFVTYRQSNYYNLPATRVLNGYVTPHQFNTSIISQAPFQLNLEVLSQVPFAQPAGTDIKWQFQTSGGGIVGAGSVAVFGYLVQMDGSSPAAAL